MTTLTLLHQRTLESGSDRQPAWPPIASELQSGHRDLSGLAIETCQRRLWVGVTRPGVPLALGLGRDRQFEVFEGESAYRFLLEIATGLASQIRGEADVLGQIKQAWLARPSRDLGADGELNRELAHWMQNLFRDAGEIRAEYLQHVSSGSYGALIRRVLRAQVAGHASSDQDLVLAGTGVLAESVTPFLGEFVHGQGRLWVANRSSAGLRRWAAGAGRKLGVPSTLADTEERLTEALTRGRFYIVCAPAGSEWDRELAARASACSRTTPATVLHLGGSGEQCAPWRALPGRCLDLGELLTLQHGHQLRSAAQFARAERACRERAKLRHLPGTPVGSVSLAHGWEDLGAFA